MAPVRKLNDGMEGLRNERYNNLRRVRRKDYQDSGGAQRQFQEMVEEFNTEERGDNAREKAKDNDRADIAGKNEAGETKEDDGVDKLETLNRKASYKVRNSHSDDEPVGGKIDING